ncbi:MAG: YciI family protein [Alphaproteobacteria bacterium]|nr:YciI family protein [Alphaproteobacteria bacterium]
MEWVIKCVSKPDMVERRAAALKAHIAHLDMFKVETWYSGPMMVGDGSNANGSFRVIDFPTREKTTTYIETDPYTLAAIFKSIDIKRVFPYTDLRQRNHSQTECNAQFVIVSYTDPISVAEVPDAQMAEFLAKHVDKLIFAGMLAEDDGKTGTGVLYVIDVVNRDAADAFVAGEPLSRGPDGRSLTIERWRFGHV